MELKEIERLSTFPAPPQAPVASASILENYSERHKLDFPHVTPLSEKDAPPGGSFRRPSKPSAIYLVAALGASCLRFSRRSTMHGLNHLAQARTAQRRLFWLCISLASSFGFFFNLFFLMEKYLQMPVLTNVLHDSDNFIFPDVTFCNVNPIHFPPNGTPEFERIKENIREFEDFKRGPNPFAQRLALADYLFIKRNTYYVHPKWLTIVECSYMQTPCSSEHFDEKIIWPYGACYTFNATRMPHNMTREISTRTRYNRFRPDLRVIVYKALEFPEGYRFDPHDSFQVPPGVLLMIHEPGTYPHIGHSGIVDECTQVELKMTSVTHLAKLGKCIPIRSRISYVNVAKNESQTFLSSQSDCLDAEVQSALAKYCGCQMHTMPIMYEYHYQPFCFSGALDPTFLENCFNNATASVDRKHCFLDVCEHYTIDQVIAHTKFPAIEDRHTELHWLQLLARLEARERNHYGGKSDLAKLALKNASRDGGGNWTLAEAVNQRQIDLLNIDFVNRNFMMLRVVPASLFMDRVEETEEYPFSRLLSDIGGCVGLWIGASLITLFELVDLLLDFLDLGGIGGQNTNHQQHLSGHSSDSPQRFVVDSGANLSDSRPTLFQHTSKDAQSTQNCIGNSNSVIIKTPSLAKDAAAFLDNRTVIPIFYMPNTVNEQPN
ncbi:unnamed protein product [Dibothriocephalus latus]|uniref:Amiloride-sensitive sodium channel n=1 Tax=Dibothriocephalus latus TaxID=60516 RepID=A0A3P7LUS4_DIBLA|nr:unnamed protein product [Dibothriocephalus latus]